MKIRAGRFEVWHVGRMAYEVRSKGRTLARAGNLSEAHRQATQFRQIEATGDQWNVLADLEAGA